jgi:hypothetical protein
MSKVKGSPTSMESDILFRFETVLLQAHGSSLKSSRTHADGKLEDLPLSREKAGVGGKSKGWGSKNDFQK